MSKIFLEKQVIYPIVFGLFIYSSTCYSQKINPFERPGSRQAKPPPIIRPAPPPPAPKPVNPNIELRGIFKFKDEWHFSLFDRGSNKGAWLKLGQSFDEGNVEIESFNPETEELSLKGGFSLTLKNSTKQVLPVPSGQPVAKKPAPPGKGIFPKRTPTQENRPRAISIPPRVNIPPRK